MKREKLEETESLLRIKLEKMNSEQTITNEQLKIKKELLEQHKVKQESTDSICIKKEIETSKETQSNSQTQDGTFRTITPQRIPNPNSRPQRPKKNALSLAKIASIDTQDLFTYNNTSNSFSNKQTSTKEMVNKEPHIETEIDRFPHQFNSYRSKKRQNIDTLFDKYDLGIEIFNEDGTVEDYDVITGTKTISPVDTDLELLLSSPKRIRSKRNISERSEIDEITQKYDFIQKDNSLLDCDELIVNRSISSTEYSVRIKCERYVYSFQMKQDTPFSETIEKLARKLEISPKQIMLTHQDETILSTDNLSILNLDENTILDAIVLSTGFISPEKTQEPIIKIKIQFAKNLCGQVQIMAPLTADLKGILTQICESKELTPSKFRFQFDGDPMDLSCSLQDYGLEDGDVIDAIMVT